MTDNDIIKALECCSVGTFACSEECPCFHSKSNLKVTSCRFELLCELSDLINRQKAEIERLKTENLILSQKRVNLYERLDIIDRARYKAITEFAERLKKEAYFDSAWCVLPVDGIDQIAKEMKEGVTDTNVGCKEKGEQ